MKAVKVKSVPDIALFIPSFTGGGAERVMVLLANGFAQRGLAVQLVVLSEKGPYRELLDPAVELIVLPGRRMAFAPLTLARYLRQHKPPVLLATLNYANVAAVFAKKLAGVSTRVWLKQANHLSTTLALSKGAKARLLSLLIGWAYRRADGVVAVSGNVAEDLMVNWGLEHVSVIHNPAYDPEHAVLAAQPVEYPASGWEAYPEIIAVGRLVPQKDYPTLLRAFREVVREKGQARLVILGEGALLPELKSQAKALGIEEYVWFAGFVENPFAYIKRASVFALCSVSEGFGNVLVEAMGLGVPVVSTNCSGGPAEILENGKWGQLVPIADVKALAQALITVLDGKGIDGRERALDFSLNAVLDQYQALLLPEQQDVQTKRGSL